MFGSASAQLTCFGPLAAVCLCLAAQSASAQEVPPRHDDLIKGVDTFDYVTLKDCANRAFYRQSILASEEALNTRAVVGKAVNLKMKRDQLDGQFVPQFQSGVNFKRAFEGTPLSIMDPRGRYSTTSVQGNVGIGGALPLGGNYTFGLQTGSTWSTMSSTTLSPFYNNRLAFNATQPLAKGAGWDIARVERNVAEVESRQLHQEQRRWGTRLMVQVVTAYWNLWAEERNLAMAKRALEEAHRVGRAVEIRHKKGQLITARHLQAQRLIKQINQSVYNVQQRLFRAERNLLFATYIPPEGSTTPDADHLSRPLRTTDEPTLERDSRSMQDLIDIASDNHPYIKESAYLIKAAALRLKAAENASLPKIDFVLGAGLGAMAGESTYGMPGHEAAVKPPPDIHIGSYGAVWGENLWGNGLPFIEAGIKMELPFHTPTRTLQERQAFFNLKFAEITVGILKQDVAIRIRDAVFQQHAAYEKIRAAQEVAEAAYEEYKQHLRDFKDGLDNSEQMLRVMLVWIESKITEIQTRADYAVAFAELRAATGDLIEYLGAEPVNLDDIPPVNKILKMLADPKNPKGH